MPERAADRESWGGARSGAGRPPAKTVRLEIRVLPRTAHRIRAAARRENKSLGEVVDALSIAPQT